jgi:NAD(P)-dependent dehydrogenase (short-subunit alcohol dehydrogenase family)
MSRRVAIVTQAGDYVGPALAERLAEAGHDLILQGAPAGLAERVARHGGAVEIVAEPLDDAVSCARLVARAIERFGRIDAAAVAPRTGPPHYFSGPFLDATVQDWRGMQPYVEGTIHLLQGLIPPMRRQGSGQILVLTSAAGKRPEAGWSLYGAVRAAQSLLVQAVALEHAADGLSINGIGSKNVVFPGFPGAPAEGLREDRVEPGAWAAPLVAETPLGRVGTLAELAHFALTLLDGRSTFQTGQFFGYSGGWDVA